MIRSLAEVSRDRIQSLALYISLVGVGWGLGVIWTAALTMRAAGTRPPQWAVDLMPAYELLAGVGAALLLVGTVVVFAVDYADADDDSTFVGAD